MADPGTVATDIQVAEIEKELKAVYNKAYKDILQKQKEFQAKYQTKDAIYQKKLANGEITNEQYQAWLKGQVFQGEQWQAKKKQMLDTIYNTNTIATEIINGKMSGVFAGNANYMAYSLEKSVGVSFGFGLYDSATVVNLIKNNPTLLPPKKLDPVKDKAWNNKKINRAIALGIVEGESLDKIATRLADVTSSTNFNSMRTIARTAMTGAQNAGREFRLQEAADLGIGVKKEWMATLDEVTRLMHRELDGQKQDLDKPFEVGGLKIRYPGDPTAKGMLVYNCRCTMVGDIDEYPATYNRYDNIDGKPIQGMTYKEWEEAKKSGKDLAPKALTFSHKEIPKPSSDDDKQELLQALIDNYGYDGLMTFFGSIEPDEMSELTKIMLNIKGDPMDIWEAYLKGDIDDPGLTDFLTEIAKKKGLIKEKSEDDASAVVKGLFKDKKMSNIYNEMKALDSKEANKFYKELKDMGKPSDVWQQYLDGTLDPDKAKKITEYLEKYADKAGLMPKEINFAKEYAGKKMSSVYNEMKDIDKTAANKFYKELQSMGKPSEVWQAYLDGTLDKDTTKKLNDLLKKHTEAMSKKTVKVENAVDIKNLFEKYDTYKDMPPDLAIELYNLGYSTAYSSGWSGVNALWKKYTNGNLDPNFQKKLEDVLEKYAKKNGLITSNDKVVKPEAPKKKKPSGDPLKDAQNELKAAQDAINNSGLNLDKQYEGIWKEHVKLSDYEAKKSSIAAKKKYFEDEIYKLKNDPDYKSWWNTKVKESNIFLYEKHLKTLEEFEEKGKEYSKLLDKLAAAKDKVKQLSPKPKVNATGTIFDEDLFSEGTKKNVSWFTSKKDADKFHRQYLDSIWDNLTDAEKYGIWEYTRNSNPMNKSLSGYHDSWSRSSFVGIDKAVWGHEDSWRSIPSAFKKFGTGGHCTYHKAIADATKAIDKSKLPQGVRLVRGSDNSGFAGMIEGNVFSFDQAKKLLNNGSEKEISDALVGQVIQNHAFTSTGIAKGTGFGGEVAYEIYAPKGTRAIYAEPQSYFGNTINGAELYKKGQHYSSVGGEAEVILQRGTEFRITGIKKSGYTTIVQMEVVAQPNYFKYGDEDTYNAGQTRHKK